MAIYKAKQLYIDIEEQDYPDADCKYMISLWHTPDDENSRELVAIGLSNNMPKVMSTRNKGNVVESVTQTHTIEIPNGKSN